MTQRPPVGLVRSTDADGNALFVIENATKADYHYAAQQYATPLYRLLAGQARALSVHPVLGDSFAFILTNAVGVVNEHNEAAAKAAQRERDQRVADRKQRAVDGLALFLCSMNRLVVCRCSKGVVHLNDRITIRSIGNARFCIRTGLIVTVEGDGLARALLIRTAGFVCQSKRPGGPVFESPLTVLNSSHYFAYFAADDPAATGTPGSVKTTLKYLAACALAGRFAAGDFTKSSLHSVIDGLLGFCPYERPRPRLRANKRPREDDEDDEDENRAPKAARVDEKD